jgi:type I restriction enzyme M protein
MPPPPNKKRSANGPSGGTQANIGYEEKLWQAADTLRGAMDAAEYKHVVLGLIFLKYVSDSYEERRQWLLRETANPTSEYFVKKETQRGYVLEDRDEYTGQNVFWVPMKARWQEVQKFAKKPEIGQLIDDAMDLIEKENPVLKGVLPKNYARPEVDKRRLGELIDLLSNIDVGGERAREMDVLGRIYEYFIAKFASSEGKSGGEFYTPSCVVRLLVEMIEPYKGRVYDPCCGSGGMFVQSEKFVEAHGGQRHDLTINGQELNLNTWRLCKMNLAIRGLEGNLGPQWGDTFHKDLHPDLKADFILANPPFNISDWGGDKLQEDKRWKYGPPPPGNANFAWIQHMVHHLAPGGIAGFVMANGSMSSNQSGEGEIRKALVEADLVDCMIALPGQLFYSVQIPVCLWFLTRSKSGRAGSPSRPPLRDRYGQTLFIDARNLGTMVDRTHKELTAEDIAKIANTYHAWRSSLPSPPGRRAGDEGVPQNYQDIAGFSKSATIKEIAAHSHVLTPGRYVGAEEAEDDGEPFEAKMKRLTATLEEQFAESARLEKAIRENLKGPNF